MVATAVMLVAGAGLLFLLVTQLSRDPEVRSSFGPPVFKLNKAVDLAAEIDERGPPVFQAPQGGGVRDIYVNHLGGAATAGWIAFDAYRTGGPRRCQLRWRQASKRFTDPCTGETYGPDPGPAFRHYLTTVEPSGRLAVDFRRPVVVTSTTGG
jgi:hypothetical protein